MITGFFRRLKQVGYICCNTTLSVLIESFGCDPLRMLCLPEQCVHHSQTPLRKCKIRDCGYSYELPDLWPHLRCGQIFNDHFITRLLLSPPEKEF